MSLDLNQSVFDGASGDHRPCKTIVRLRRSYWHDDRSVHVKATLSKLARLSTGYDMLLEEATQIGAEDLIDTIINLNECQDGLYQLVSCNHTTDWETGLCDSYDYKLIPFKPKAAP